MSLDFLLKLRDAGQMIADAANEALDQLAPAKIKSEKPTEEPKKAEKPTLQEIEGLTSTEQNSSKGTYRLVTKETNKDNPVFNKLQTYLNSKNGFAQICGFKAWNFSNSTEKIGLRKS